MDHKTAVRMAYASYIRNPDIFRKFGCYNCERIIAGNDEGTFAEHIDFNVFAIAGTDDFIYLHKSLKDWLDNFCFFSDKIPLYGSMHVGFFECHRLIRDKLYPILETKSRIKPLKIIGHSKGGAIAQLLAYTLKRFYYYTDIEVFTYGSPRVGNIEFAQRFEDSGIKHHRFVNGKDPVPRVPRAYMGYVHASKEILMKNGWWSFLWFGDFSDHKIRSYIKSVDKLNL